MSKVLADTLGSKLHYKVRQAFDRQWQSMWRDLDWYAENRPAKVAGALQNGWSLPQLRAIAVLNAFYRVVLGPLGAAFDTTVELGLGWKVPVTYGSSLRVARDTAVPLKAALAEFRSITGHGGIKNYWLNLGSADELLFAIGRTDADGNTKDDE